MLYPYFMWFMRFGSPHLVTQMSIEDCYELDWMLDNAETYIFDQYGCLNYVEHVETGVISDEEWEAGLNKYIEEQRHEDEKEKVKNPPRQLFGEIRLAPPADFRSRGVETYRTYYVESKMLDDYKTLYKHLGDRVSLIQYNTGDTK